MITKEQKVPSGFLYESKLLSERANPLFEKTPTFARKEPKKTNTAMTFRDSASEIDFQEGEKVRHKKFGEGLIVAITGDQITVAFSAEFGVKTLVANFIEKL